MDRSAVNDLITRHANLMKEVMSLSGWDILILLDSTLAASDGWMKRGEAVWKLEYERATITLNPDALDNPVKVLDTLRHELIHLVLAPYYQIYDIAAVAGEGNEKLVTLTDHIYTRSMEQAVLAVERMLNNLGFTPANILAGKWVPADRTTAGREPDDYGGV